MDQEFTDADLEAYLDEALDHVRASDIEQAARENPELIKRLAHINRRRDAGVHTLGEIWRAHQLGVPSRDTVAEFLLGVLEEENAAYIQFRLDVLKCPFTIALKKDLESQQGDEAVVEQDRRSKIYKSSAGLLRNDKS